MRKDFSRVMSVVNSGAERSPDRGEFPNVKNGGATNAVVSNHRSTDCCSPLKDASRRMFGRIAPAGNALVVLATLTTVKTEPDCAVSSNPTFHPPAILFTK